MASVTTLQQHAWDVVVRSVKTGLAAYAAFLVAGGMNILHVPASIQTKVAALAALATALLNIALKVHTAMTTQPPTVATPPSITTTEVPTVVPPTV